MQRDLFSKNSYALPAAGLLLSLVTSAVSGAAVFILAAVSALMSFAMTASSVMVPFSVVAALDIRIVGKISFKKRLYSLIGAACDTAVQLDSCIRKGILCPHTDSS